MSFISNLFFSQTTAQAVVVLAIAIFAGLAVGRIKIAGVRLGVGGVLFSGIALGHFGMGINPSVLHYAQEFGLILFVYGVGMSVGPTFMESFRQSGMKLNALAVMIVFLGVATAIACFKIFGLDADVAVGLFCGGVTNTPALSAASQMFGELGDKFNAAESIRTAGMGYAVAYPFGIFGIILTMLLVKGIFKVDTAAEARLIEEERRAENPELIGRTLVCTNPALFGRTLGSIQEIKQLPLSISRCKESNVSGKAEHAVPSLELKEGMLLYCVTDRLTMEKAVKLIGFESDIDILEDEGLIYRIVVVSAASAVGKTLRQLGLIRSKGIKVTRLSRRGTVILANPDLRLQFADRIRIVGDADSLDRAEKIVGNNPHEVEHPQVMSLFFGIFAGVLLGSIPVFIPGLPAPLKVGLAGGPLVMSIILSRRHRFLGMTFYMTPSANMMVREIGIGLFLACVGVNAGGRFVDTLVNGQGLFWMAVATLITALPLLAAAFVGYVLLKIRYGTLCGVLSGAMTDPPALAFASQMLKTDAPASGYATVYPLTMFLRIFSGQILVLLFSAMTF